jgi:glycosyltransferase involved in cell wall biosynthesis
VPDVRDEARPARVTVLYIAPWIDLGGSDRNTVDLLRWLDRDRYRVILATTQESRNRRLNEAAQYVDEVWALPELVPGGHFPGLLADLIATRQVDVVHIMNSRLAFDLLPDLVAMPEAPGVLVQLHVEEADRTGYVRYVTTRYGNLVDAWSVSSRNLGNILEDYGVLPSAIEVIYTGIDADDEFNPERTAPVELDPDRFHILYLGRWVEQKDPLLMLEVAAGLHARHPAIQVHAVGEGDLEQPMRARIAELGLEDAVILHATTSDVQSWFRASDAMLMTSVYEGLPLVLFEAMAMGVPSVVPALPANLELMGDEAGSLIEPRYDVAGYVGALAELVEHDDRRRQIGESARARVRAGFGLQDMADRHGRLYDAIVAQRGERRRRRSSGPEEEKTAEVRRSQDEQAPTLPSLRFTRSIGEKPLVSIVIPCYNHGRWLPETLRSIEEQDYPLLETIVVDDRSTDSRTIELLDELERSAKVQVIRRPVNGGPSPTRNAGIDVARGRYVLPVDADNLLLPGAVTRLVDQLEAAGELVGFIYPNQQFFGNRDDYAEAPAWNPYLLLFANYCDTCSLYDRDVFDAGLRYAEEIVLGHEDWDLALQLAGAGIRGEPAHGPTVLSRKHGFTRSDLVNHVQSSFGERVRKRHRALFDGVWGRSGPYAGPPARAKATWSPYLSIVALSELDTTGEPWRRLAERLARQTCGDAELLVPVSGRLDAFEQGPLIRRIPPASDDLREGRLGIGLAMVRGRVVLVSSGTASPLLKDPAAIEKLARVFGNPEVDAIAFVEPTGPESVELGIAPEPEPWTTPHSLAWRTGDAWLPEYPGSLAGHELSSLARALVRGGARMHWRFARGHSAPPEATGRAPRFFRRPAPDAAPLPAAVPSQSERESARWREPWSASESSVLYRHRRIGSEERHQSLHAQPPAGFVLDHIVGAARMFTPPGTTKLYATQGGSYLTTALPEAKALIGPDDRYLGSVETVGFLGLDGLLLGVMHATGQHVLVAGRNDPLLGAVDVQAELGWVEPVPLWPRAVPAVDSTFGLVGLFRSLDVDARRHRYAVGAPPVGELVGELGALHDEAQEGSVPLWVSADGRVSTSPEVVAPLPPSRGAVAHWVAAPAAWRGFGNHQARARSVVRRARDARRALQDLGPVVAPFGGPAGFLLSQGGAGRVPLFTAFHPVTHDQLLTSYPLEAQDMGYIDITLLGWLSDRAPMTGSRDLQRLSVPWASRYGLEARRQ